MTFGTWWFGERRAVLRRLEREPRRRIADISDGMRAAIAGTAEPIGDLLAGPLSDRPCIHWFIEIHEVGASEFRVCGRDEAGVEFLVRDDSGVARVIPQGAAMALAGVVTSEWLRNLRARAFFERLEVRVNHGTSKIRVREYLIAPAAMLRLAGTATREPDPEPSDAPPDGYRGELASRPVFAHTRHAPLAIADGG